LDTVNAAEPGKPGLPEIIAALEQQLVALDRIGARIAAAHLDAAIQQLRLEQARSATC
jgi:hypothetical protein